MILWQEQVIRQLLEAGSQGIQNKHLVNSVNYIPAEEVVMFLETLRAEHAVQRFRYNKAYHWRGTDILPTII